VAATSAALALLATGLMATTAYARPVAPALPPRCDDGSPPPCEPPPDPDPTPNPNPPPTNPWRSLVSVLDQSEAGYDSHVLGAWISTGSPVYSTPSGTVQWTTPAHNQGSISISSTYLPAGSLAGFQLWEQDQSIDGPLCRTTPLANIPQVLEYTHVLLGDTKTTTAAELAQMADDFEGTVSIPESESGTYSATIDLHEVTIVPGPGGLALTIKGHLFVDGPGPFNIDSDFRFTAEVHLSPSKKAEVEHVVSASVSDDALVIFGEDADREAELLPAFRKAVIQKVSDKVDAQVAANPEVQWFASLGFTASFRDVTIDDAGIHVLPSLCKVG
jgi:hypothetical protein